MLLSSIFFFSPFVSAVFSSELSGYVRPLAYSLLPQTYPDLLLHSGNKFITLSSLLTLQAISHL